MSEQEKDGLIYGRIYVDKSNICEFQNLRRILSNPVESGADYFMEVGALRILAKAFGENAQ